MIAGGTDERGGTEVEREVWMVGLKDGEERMAKAEEGGKQRKTDGNQKGRMRRRGWGGPTQTR